VEKGAGALMDLSQEQKFKFRLRLEQEQGASQIDPQSQPKPGLMGRAWNALQWPEQKSREGLNKIAQAIPEGKITGNMPMDLLRGTPRIAANTLAQAAPGFISRGAMLTAGAVPAMKAAAPLAGAIREGIGSQLESLSGTKPGLLKAAFKDPSLIFATIPKAAREAYQAENEGLTASKLVTENPHPMGMIMKAKRMADEGTLSSGEALEARKNLDGLWKRGSITEGFKNSTRKAFDAIVKEKESLQEADTAFSRGKKAAGLRQMFPQNKYGGTSAFKLAIMEALSKMGMGGKAAMALMSPAAMGTGATALGAGAKLARPILSSPSSAVTALQAYRQARKSLDDQ
jgi:hypothetical protein